MSLIRLLGVMILIATSDLAGLNAREPDGPGIEERWEQADDAYRTGETARGHALLRELVEDYPGDYDLAVRCLSRILGAASRHVPENPWPEYASSRLRALERLGVISPSSWAAHRAFDVQGEADARRGRLFEVLDDVDRLARENPHDPEWQVRRAIWHRKLDSAETAELYAELRRRMDLNDPDDRTRALWAEHRKEIETDSGSLPAPLLPLPEGSFLHLLEPEDPDGLWRDLMEQRLAEVVETADRLAGAALGDDQSLLWRDRSGLMDPVRAIDLHLLRQPLEGRVALAKLQDDHFALEPISEQRSDAEILQLSRRYTWSRGAQEQLLGLAQRSLWAGRAHAAFRSFEQVLAHANDAELLEQAQVGLWVATSLIHDRATLNEAFEGIDADRTFPWMGRRVSVSEISAALTAASTDRASHSGDRALPALEDLPLSVLRIPPVSPWPSSSPAATLPLDFQLLDNTLLVSGRNLVSLYDLRDLSKPRWSRSRRSSTAEDSKRVLLPGYFRPTIDRDIVYVRSSFTAAPRGITAFDLETGQPRWSSEFVSGARARSGRGVVSVPLCDPVAADGLLFYLEWRVRGDVGQQKGRRLVLVAFDPDRRREAWSSTIAAAGEISDLPASLERAQPSWAIYGNRVTIHGGSVYASSNSGIVARLDARDGRVDWLHFYRRGQQLATTHGLGSAPIVHGDHILCMPRDTGRVFALDGQTGRLVWDNPLVLARESLGIFDGHWIIRGESALIAIDARSGKLRWHRPLAAPALARSQLVGADIYTASTEAIERLDAKTGTLLESRDWGVSGERPQAFSVSDSRLFLVTDLPAKGAEGGAEDALNPEGDSRRQDLQFPLVRAWELPRSHASIAQAPADTPEDSPLRGKAFVLSGGLLECIEVSSRGGVLWRRFVHLLNPSVHFHGDSIVLIERGGQGPRSRRSRVLALRGADGSADWQQFVSIGIEDSLRHGSIELLRDRHGNVVALDLETGRVLWERHFGPGELQWARVGERLHVALRAAHRSALHVSVDVATGEEADEHVLEVADGKTRNNNGIPLDNGFYEVRFAPRQARYVRLRMLSEINGRGWSSIAELEVAGRAGDNVPRDSWRVVHVDSTETQARYDTRPETVFDGDPTSWWHTQWIGGIPPHPHEMVIDTGRAQELAALRYLPAVIINNNGMIKHYELFTSLDGKSWGDPVARGILVGRLQIQSPRFADGGLYFQVQHHQTKLQEVFRYDLDKQPAKRISRHGRLVETLGKYAILADHEGRDQEVLVVLRADDPSYRFELGPVSEFHGGQHVRIDGKYAYLGSQQIVVADLEARSFLARPPRDDSERKKQGWILREGDDRFLKIVNEGAGGQVVTMFDVSEGSFSRCVLEDQTAPFRDPRHSSQQRETLRCAGVLLLYDGSTVSAWVSADALATSG